MRSVGVFLVQFKVFRLSNKLQETDGGAELLVFYQEDLFSDPSSSAFSGFWTYSWPCITDKLVRYGESVGGMISTISSVAVVVCKKEDICQIM